MPASFWILLQIFSQKLFYKNFSGRQLLILPQNKSSSYPEIWSSGDIIIPRKEYVKSIIFSTRPFGNLGISILASAPRNQHRHYKKFLFLPFEVSYEENIYKSFSSTLAHLSGSFSRCLVEFQQLFCKKPVSTCFWRKEIHSRRYLRTFRNTHGWKLHFSRL